MNQARDIEQLARGREEGVQERAKEWMEGGLKRNEGNG